MHAHPERLLTAALAAVQDERNQLFLSAASAWEIAVKYTLGRLPLPVPPHQYVPSRMERADTQPLFVTHEHALRTATLPYHHRDPFDRLLVAQCQIERLALLTADPQFEPYDLETVWAGAP